MRLPIHLVLFATVSGIGWLIDFTVLLLLIGLGFEAFVANLIGAGVAVTFVFAVSQRRVFVERHGGVIKWGLLLPYLAWQGGAVPAASALVALLTGILTEPAAAFVDQRDLDVAPVVLAAAAAKVAITPLTLYANFLFSGWLIDRRLRWY